MPAQAFYVKKAVVPAVAQMDLAYAVGGGGAEKLLGPFDVLNNHTEEVEVGMLVHLPYHFTPWRWTSSSRLERRGQCRGSHIIQGGGREAQCASLLSFLCAAAVDGSAIPFEAAHLEVVAPHKALEEQRMEILKKDLPTRFNTGGSGGPSPGDAMTLALTAFEARTDMLKRTHVTSDGAPRAVRVKTPEEKWRRC